MDATCPGLLPSWRRMAASIGFMIAQGDGGRAPRRENKSLAHPALGRSDGLPRQPGGRCRHGDLRGATADPDGGSARIVAIESAPAPGRRSFAARYVAALALAMALIVSMLPFWNCDWGLRVDLEVIEEVQRGDLRRLLPRFPWRC